MAVDDFLGKEWSDRTTGGKVLYGLASTLGAGVPIVANEAMKSIKGDKDRLAQIEAQKNELESSEFNTASQTDEAIDYYDKVFAAEAKARRAAEFGMTDAERAQANQGFAQNSNLAMQNAQNAGGNNLSKYINAAMNTNANKFQVDLAAQNDAIKRQNQQVAMNYLNMLGGAAQNSQDIQNMNFQKQILAEQAIGQAETDWYDRREAARMELLKAGIGTAGAVGGAMAGMPMGGGGVTTPTATTTAKPTSTYTPPPSPYNPNWASSDIRLKEKIVYSHQENGYKIYEFNYKGNPKERFSGVMAQEVLQINPSAVFEEIGYNKVDYSKLGVTMKKVN